MGMMDKRMEASIMILRFRVECCGMQTCWFGVEG